MATQFFGTRLRALREERNLTQDDLARLFDFKDRQTVSAIETGIRRMSAEELVLAVERLGVPLDYFTDPFRLVGEGRFSWRQTGISADKLSEYEHLASSWIALFRTLAPQVGYKTPLMRRVLNLARHPRFEDATLAGERFVVEFDLGKAPATALIEVMERELGILVLMVDTYDGISSATCRLPELDTILISRRQVEGRRHFALARELFHILTWDAMPPKHFVEVKATGGYKLEQLANYFSAAVLMPASTFERYGNWENLVGNCLITQLNSVAEDLKVTSSDLLWRLVTLGKLKRVVARSLPEAVQSDNGHNDIDGELPELFSKPFVEVIGLAIEQGHVSARRAAGLLQLTVEELVDLLAMHDVEFPIEL